MIQRGLTVQSDLLQLLIVMPTKVLLFLISVALVLPPVFTENLFLLVSLFSIATIFINSLSRQFYLRSLFVGGDLFLWLFCVVALWSSSGQNAFWSTLVSVKWIFFLYFLTYCFDLFPTINSRIFSLITAGTLVSVFAIVQTQVDLTSLFSFFSLNVVPSPFPDLVPYVATGFLQKPDVFGFLMAMVLSFPAAVFIVHHRISRRFKFLVTVSIFCILSSILLTFQIAAWAMIGLAFISLFFITRRTGSLILTAVLLVAAPYFLPKIQNGALYEKLSSSQTISEEYRRVVLRANLKMFQQAPWLGVGYNQNQHRLKEFLEQPQPEIAAGHAPNTYFQLLASTGIAGFLMFMGFSLVFLFNTLRLWQEIPKTHLWHRSFAVASLSGQMVFHGAGLFVWTLGEPTLVYPLIFSLATSSLLTRRYAQGIVPDDYSA